MKEIIKQLKENKIYKTEWGVWYLLPRRKGEVFGNNRDDGKKKKYVYQYRVKFVPSKKLKDKLCKK